ncbi:hypothetical protein C7377_1222 [Balneicella halophila]|uniref:SSD domain-containing protein n=1 Tax=Balneicella halophila TaxID=1537566 RepID=A0A7L4URF2_BALHA|nr:MMPL family transporter [Balneicella halophila]PVX50899.1 hypothetical protein C7377_1222 [Balneicella halophila]
MWQRIARIILRNRILLMIIIGVLTLFMGYQASKVQMSYQQQSVLPSTDSTLVAYENFSQEFSTEGNVIFYTLQDKDFWKFEHLKEWKVLGERIKNIKGVTAVASVVHNTASLQKDTEHKKFNPEVIFPDTLKNQEQIDSLRSRLFSIPFYKNKLYDETSHSYMMLITADKQIMDSKERIPFMNELKKELHDFTDAKCDSKTYITGLPYIRVETAQMIKKEMFLFVILSALVTAIILFLFFRSFRNTLISLLVVGVGATWAIGTMSLLGYEITLLTAMLPPLLIVIGIPNCIFMINKYHAEYATHKNKIMALQRVIMRVGNAIFLTNLTTASGFATFIITSSAILVEFGIVASINILLLFIFSIILLPSIFSMQPPPKERHTKHLEYKYVNGIIKNLVHIVEHHRKLVYVFTSIVLILSIIGISQMKNTGYVIDDLPEDGQIMTDLTFFENQYGGILPYEVIVDTKKPRGVMNLRTLRDIDNFSQKLVELEQFSSPISVAEIAKILNQSFYNGAENQYRIPTNKTVFRYLLTYAKNSGEGETYEMLKSYVDSTGQKTRLTFYMKDIGTSAMEELQVKVDSIASETLSSERYEVSTTGSSVVFYKGTNYLVRNLLLSLALAICLIALFMAFMFKSKRMAVIALIPNFIPLLVTAGLMGYFGIPIKASTILIFSIAFGISVDDTIHFLAKYRQDLGITKWKIKKSVKMALRETGQSMLYTSIILFFGFLIFSFSDFGGTKALGILVSLTLLTAMFANLILLPSMLLSLEKSISNKDFKRARVRIYPDDEDDKNLNAGG